MRRWQGRTSHSGENCNSPSSEHDTRKHRDKNDGDASTRASLVILAAIAVCGFLYWASAVFAPLIFSLLIIAVLWPIQKALQSRIGSLLALALTLGLFLSVLVGLGSMATWSLSRVAQALANDTARLQTIYDQLVAWLAGHGIVSWRIAVGACRYRLYVRLMQSLVTRLNSTLSFLAHRPRIYSPRLLEMADFKVAVVS